MQLTILGAAGGEVTGSAYLLETASSRILLDFGMFQGSHATEAKNILPGELKPGMDAVLLTHAHLDHTGRLPLLGKLGYAGPIYATAATIELADLILRDSARIQESDAERENRSRPRDGKRRSSRSTA